MRKRFSPHWPAWVAADQVLDVRGSWCPEPVISARRQMAGMRPGQVLEILATDPLAELDLRVLCERGGHRLLASQTRQGIVKLQIKVRASEPAPEPDAD